jgi:hypothetical protein
MTTRCRCCRVLLVPAAAGPLCERCAAGRCPRGRVHLVAERGIDGRIVKKRAPKALGVKVGRMLE